jgi:predicted GH43/DUF377 family glycosyl hydrolase
MVWRVDGFTLSLCPKIIKRDNMKFKRTVFAAALWLAGVAAGMAQEWAGDIDSATVAEWSRPYEGWYYYPEPVIASDYKIAGYGDFRNFDVPMVYQLEGDGKWYMSFIGFDGKGYNTFVVESDDLVHWENPRLAMGFGAEGEFDHGGCVLGAYLYDTLAVDRARHLKHRDGLYWSLYGCYPRQGGYELRPGYEGVAVSDDGLRWRRVEKEPVLSVFQSDVRRWESDCIYQPWLVEHEGTYYNFYNAAEGGQEQSGLALSNDLVHWVRYPFNPVVGNRRGEWDENFASDPKVYRDGDHWTMLYFGVSWARGGACIMAAFSRDLVHWTANPKPLYVPGGHPTGLDKEHAHKVSLVYNGENDTYYMFYCACGNRGRTIGLLTSRKIAE